ncbi:MAG: ATP-binding cassette subfamily B multidrug efflux pump [Hyphomicrobiaceae bacterium]
MFSQQISQPLKRVFARMFDPLFAWFEQSNEVFSPEQPERPPGDLWGFIKYYAWPFRWLIAACTVASAAVAMLEVLLYSYVGTLVDWLGKADKTTFWSDHAWALTGMAFVVLVLLPVVKLLNETLVNQGLMGNFAMRNRWQAHRYLLRQSINFFQNDFAGRIATKVMQSSVGVRDVVLKIADIMAYVFIYFFGALILFAASDIRLTGPLVVWLIAYVVALYYFIPILGRISMQQAEHRSMMTGRIVDSYTNIATVKMFAHADREDAYAQTGMTPFLENVHEQMRFVTLLTVTLNILNGLLIFFVSALSIWLWSINAVTTGGIAVAVGLTLRMQGMAHWIMWEVARLFENIGVVRDGINTIARDRDVVDTAGAGDIAVRDGSIAFRNITFNYGRDQPEHANRIIKGLSLDIKAGEKVGLVGRSGAGKSTLVNLLLRFHDLENGQILIDGQDISTVRQESLREHIAMVTQDTSLLHRSVRDNILYGRPDAGAEAARLAAEKAQAHEFILDLEDGKGHSGYDAHVGERGVKLSGGQRQRIAIARVLLKDAPILILDEATSALDSEVEAAIQEQLYNLMAGKTVIAIAHRLSTIAEMDRLIVMDAGQLIEQGTHAELLDKGDLYASLWARQSGGFLLQEDAA